MARRLRLDSGLPVDVREVWCVDEAVIGIPGAALAKYLRVNKPETAS